METWTQRKEATGPLDVGCASRCRGRPRREAGRVRIVGDDAAVRLVSRVNVEAEGLHVEAADGLDAFEQGRREPPDLVLTDVPGLDGFQRARKVAMDRTTGRSEFVAAAANQAARFQR